MSTAKTSEYLATDCRAIWFKPEDVPGLLDIDSLRQSILDDFSSFVSDADSSTATQIAEKLQGENLNAQQLKVLQSAGASNEAVLPLLAEVAETLGRGNYEEIMQSLGGAWCKVVEGKGHPAFNDTHIVRAILGRAVREGYIKNVGRDQHNADNVRVSRPTRLI